MDLNWTEHHITSYGIRYHISIQIVEMRTVYENRRAHINRQWPRPKFLASSSIKWYDRLLVFFTLKTSTHKFMIMAVEASYYKPRNIQSL